MNAVGLIVEYNPFHNGHLYHLKETKKLFPNDVLVLIMSGSFTQRGNPSILSKWEKTELALTFGIDLVIELPFPFATQSADIFAKGAITLLKELQVSSLVFGSESNNIEELTYLANVQNDPKYHKEVKKLLEAGNNYPTATSLALEKLTNKKVSLPNDILGLSYIKEIINQGANITPISIKRTNDYHDTNLTGNISSATSIRKNLQEGNDIKNTVPKEVIPYLKKQLFFMENYYSFLRYQIISSSDNLSSYQGVEEGIESRIKKAVKDATCYSELISRVKTKRYTYQRLNRMFTHILCHFTKEEALKYQNITYIRVLGFSKKGQSYLNKIKHDVNVPIVTKLSSSKDPMLLKEQQVTLIYLLPRNKEERLHQEKKEYQTPPLRPKD